MTSSRPWPGWSRPLVVILLGVLAIGCDKTNPKSDGESDVAHVDKHTPARELEPAADKALVARGRALVQRYECGRCHQIEGVAPVQAEYDCAGCHRQIMAGTFPADPEELAGWQANVVSLGEVPALHGTARFRRAWLTEFLQDTHDLRPGLGPSMPRFEMSADDAQALAAFLSPQAEDSDPELGDAEQGRKVLEDKGCASCHRFTGVPALPAGAPPVQLESGALARGQQLAPDLRFARERLRPETLVAWLADPQAVKPGSAMPKIPLTEQEVADAAAYLLTTPLSEPEPAAMPERPALLDREVTWDEVNTRVFGKICRHCHASVEIVGGGGPGYAGGFGLPARKLDLSSYQGVLGGSVGDDGKRRSVLKTNEDGMAKLVEHLWARHAEEAGQPVEGIRGMPLGLPPLPVEDIALIETWIAQGRRR